MNSISNPVPKIKICKKTVPENWKDRDYWSFLNWKYRIENYKRQV